MNKVILAHEPVTAINSTTYLRQNALINLIAQNPSDKQVLSLCQQWGVEPIYFGRWQQGMVNRLATLAELAKAVQ